MDRDHQRALDSLLEEFAAVLIDAADRAGGMVGVRRAAATAVKTRPAVSALLAGIDIAGREVVLDCGVLDAVVDVAEQELLLADELVAGVEIAPRRDGHVLGAGAAAGNALINARTAL